MVHYQLIKMTKWNNLTLPINKTTKPRQGKVKG
jgi:hypothetical protein